MDQIELKVTVRDVLGKKVRFMRRQGITPVHLYGHGIESVALQCDTSQLQGVLAEAGQTRLINLKFEGERRPRTVVVREVQKGIRPGELYHVDFYQVQMAEMMKVDVPIILVGESPVLKSKENMLSQDLNILNIQCLPANIPASIEIDTSVLTEIDQAIRVRDIELDEEITVLNDPELVVARIIARPVERVEEVEVAEAEVEEEEAAEAPEAAPVPEEESEKE
jgi:large subunit ribosomal protein L25